MARSEKQSIYRVAMPSKMVIKGPLGSNCHDFCCKMCGFDSDCNIGFPDFYLFLISVWWNLVYQLYNFRILCIRVQFFDFKIEIDIKVDF